MYISPVSAEYMTLGALRPSIGGLAPEDAGKFLNFQLPRSPRCRRQPRDVDNISPVDALPTSQGSDAGAPRHSLCGLPNCCHEPLQRQHKEMSRVAPGRLAGEEQDMLESSSTFRIETS